MKYDYNEILNLTGARSINTSIWFKSASLSVAFNEQNEKYVKNAIQIAATKETLALRYTW